VKCLDKPTAIPARISAHPSTQRLHTASARQFPANGNRHDAANLRRRNRHMMKTQHAAHYRRYDTRNLQNLPD
jgi:hypothetical protein